MKKYFRFALAGLALFALATSVVSCGDDNEEKPTPVPTEKVVYGGTTVTYPVADESQVYESTRGTYEVEYSTTDKTAVLLINNANFLEGMPPLGTMSFPGINWAADNANNGFMLQKDALTPEIANRPFPAFPISNLTAFEVPGKSLELTFICNYKNTPYQVTFSGTPVA